MKKTTIILFALLVMGGVANAQYYYYNTRPWDGNKSYSLHIGTDFSITPRNFGETTTDLVAMPGLAASFRYEGDKSINERLSWGYQVEVNYLAENFSYNQATTRTIGNATVPVVKHNKFNWWDGEVDFRLSLAYWIGDNIELQAAAGIFVTPIFGLNGETYETLASSDVEVADSRKETKVPLMFNFNFNTGISTMIQAKYFFNENFYVSLSARDNIGLNLFGGALSEGNDYANQGGQRGIVMLGVGYKFIK